MKFLYFSNKLINMSHIEQIYIQKFGINEYCNVCLQGIVDTNVHMSYFEEKFESEQLALDRMRMIGEYLK